MSEVNENETAETTETVEVIESVGFVKEIKDTVTKQVSKDLVYGQFVGVLVKQKIDARATSLQKSFDTLTKHAGELNKIRAKSTGFGEDFKPLPKTFTADEVKKSKEIKEKMARLEAAIKKALVDTATEDDWKKLDEAISKNG